MSRLGVLVSVAVIAMSAVMLSGRATGQQTNTLEGRIRLLESVVRALDARIAVLERSQKPGSPVSFSKAVWRNLRRGLTADQVESLLGEPVKVEAHIVTTYWCYSKSGILGPRVLFDSHTMLVSGWTEPD